MKVAAQCVVLMATLVGSAVGELPPPQTSYKILLLLPLSTKSHNNVFVTFAEALANRGHKVVMLTNHPRVSSHPNITELTHGLTHFREENLNMFNLKKQMIRFQVLADIHVKYARDLYHVAEVMDLYKRRKEFDLIVVDHTYNEIAYPFLHEVPFITLSPVGFEPRVSASVGNVPNPSFIPNFLDYLPSHPSLWNRFMNTARFIADSLFYKTWVVNYRIQHEISVHFPDLPPLMEIERNQSLALINTHFTIEKTIPLLPSQVEVGAMHCRPARPLSETLESWVTSAGSAGVIFFSLGSLTRGNSMPVKYRDLFLEAFRRLPQRVLWKYEEELETAPDNVMTSKWLPQQDILAHDNVKVFISHGGLLSLQEAIYHTTPLLVLPIHTDQPKNGMFVEASGLGLTLAWEELTVDIIVDTLNKIINNHKYKDNVETMSRKLRDQLTTPQERAVFWTEYVIRHRGAPQLRCPAAQLSWVEFLMLDVLTLLLVATVVLSYILHRIFTSILANIFTKKKKTE